jgi:small subunit ribosomal protein S17
MADEPTNEKDPEDDETIAEAEPEPEVEAQAAAAEAPPADVPVEPAEEEAPPAEAPAAPEEVAKAPAKAATPAGPKRSKKREPRVALRKARKAKPAKPKERKPIVRLPKPEGERGRRQERRGVVVSAAMDKTIVVKVDTIKAHPRYKKVVRRSNKFHAHDERNEAHVGDIVRIVETRPLSKTKNWRLAEIVEAAR